VNRVNCKAILLPFELHQRPAAVEWMKDCEEIAPFCSESDDFADEAEEVLRDQVPVFPIRAPYLSIGGSHESG
jgi:hypothetical protein